MKLSELSVGCSAVVKKIYINSKIASRLKALNIFEGGNVTVLRKAPFGGGLMLKADGVRVALRFSIASQIEIEMDNTGESL